jgi:hypothetical protein
MNRLLMLGLFFSLSACATRMESRPNAPPPMMSYEEVVELGSSYAQQRGYGYQFQEAHLANGHLWAVNFHISDQDQRGRLHLEYDAYSRQLLAADARLGRRHHEDNDGEHNDGEHNDGEHNDGEHGDREHGEGREHHGRFDRDRHDR